VPTLSEIALAWLRIGCLGFGGPPAHIALLRDLCVGRRRWLSEEQFAHAVAACNVLPGPASTQVAIYCAWRLRGRAGALVGGLCFIVPGLVAILALSALLLSSSPPKLLLGAAAGAASAVAAVAVRTGIDLARPMLAREPARRAAILVYAAAGGLAAARTGPWLVLVLLGAGGVELLRSSRDSVTASALLLALGTPASGGLLALSWTALKVGALAFGGGFVIVPLMQADAVSTYHWMSHAQFANAVALGQLTPGPLLQTVAAVGYAADGLPGGLLAAVIAFAPSFAFVIAGGGAFERLLVNERARAFLRGAAPAAAGAIVGAAVPLSVDLREGWQLVVLGCAAVALLVLRRGTLPTMLLAALAGLIVAALGGAVPG
jgi:chromate transporter